MRTLWWMLGLCLLGILIGWALESFLIHGASIVALCGVLSRIWGPRTKTQRDAQPAASVNPAPSAKPPRPAKPRVAAADQSSFIDAMIEDGRYALLLRPEIVDNLNEQQLELSLELFRSHTSGVPSGPVRLAQPELSMRSAEGAEFGHAQEVEVEGVFIDRFAVTNEQFQRFVESGCYDDTSLWDAEIIPAMPEFVDRTGLPGPRFWSNGQFEAGKDRHPVVGINWFEASAYASWVGKRLPTDPEWAKAAIWPVSVSGRLAKQRKYPWGEDFSPQRANLSCSQKEGTVEVDTFESGKSAGNVYQLTGNVWEWNSDDFGQWLSPGRPVESAQPLKACRGGAFDTFFEHQAISQFQSGDSPLARKHNIGFRCVVPAQAVSSKALALLHSQKKPKAEVALA